MSRLSRNSKEFILETTIDQVTYIHFSPELLQPLLADFVMAFVHVVWLLGIEGIGDGAEDEDVQLDPLLSLLFLLTLFLLKCISVQVELFLTTHSNLRLGQSLLTGLTRCGRPPRSGLAWLGLPVHRHRGDRAGGTVAILMG